MKTAANYIDDIKVKLGVDSDYAVAAKIGISRSSISAVRHKGMNFDGKTAIKVANLLDIDPALVIIDMHHARAKDPEEASILQRIYNFLNDDDNDEGGSKSTGWRSEKSKFKKEMEERNDMRSEAQSGLMYIM
jgi:transcriptional regulator with XRE-family HTH domain